MKNLVDRIIQDLGEDKPIKGILLKAQIVASKLNNNDFKTWIENEQNGYPDASNLPDYRVLNAIVKADLSIPFSGYVRNYTIPAGIYDDPIIEECICKVRITHSLQEIETIYENKKGGNVSTNLPAMAYTEVNKYVSGNVEQLKQEFSVASLIHIVDIFKSKLLSFFLDIEKEMNVGINFSKIEEQQDKITQIMNTYYINSAIANTGAGSVSAGDIRDNTSLQIISDSEQKEKFLSLVSQLKEEANSLNNSDLTETIDLITEECNKPSWAKRTLRVALNAVQGIATGIAANQLTPIVTNALALL
ncbi:MULTISPECIES: hypothetical protein [Bacteroidales]|jgi:hypothetical protein|uniref:Uncharacterized protein n=1 Tax=Lepagella muris TaxID=3032870 RepID=A0AC61RKB1_9BACT|nr:hypothetical protein [Lepagella muris]ROT07757.1 hypothetical protein EEL33_06900 [Muribaculaceae bacterium Isolate-037 (Harlan)]TGY78527.1 hypothetical protein E5331_09385 [Lepagella muris]THG51981.1 hypothetical protein E5984_08665 [Bacteroidales bacterium]TKC54876.1 hypothetical protein E5359_015945 [Bacteroidales bacterium]